MLKHIRRHIFVDLMLLPLLLWNPFKSHPMEKCLSLQPMLTHPLDLMHPLKRSDVFTIVFDPIYKDGKERSLHYFSVAHIRWYFPYARFIPIVGVRKRINWSVVICQDSTRWELPRGLLALCWRTLGSKRHRYAVA